MSAEAKNKFMQIRIQLLHSSLSRINFSFNVDLKLSRHEEVDSYRPLAALFCQHYFTSLENSSIKIAALAYLSWFHMKPALHAGATALLQT